MKNKQGKVSVAVGLAKEKSRDTGLEVGEPTMVLRNMGSGELEVGEPTMVLRKLSGSKDRLSRLRRVAGDKGRKGDDDGSSKRFWPEEFRTSEELSGDDDDADDKKMALIEIIRSMRKSDRKQKPEGSGLTLER